jgi:hypothetical protein
MRASSVLAVSVTTLILLLNGCRAQSNAASPFTADFITSSTVLPTHSGKLYVSGNRLRADWGDMSDIFDLKTRKGWRIFQSSKVYMELGTKDLSTYAPEMENGSVCPHAEVPSSCKLIGSEVVENRAAKKWDLYNPNKGFHVYFWTDEAQEVTLRMEIGDTATYQVKNVHNGSVPDGMFELPTGFQKIERRFKP